MRSVESKSTVTLSLTAHGLLICPLTENLRGTVMSVAAIFYEENRGEDNLVVFGTNASAGFKTTEEQAKQLASAFAAGTETTIEVEDA